MPKQITRSLAASVFALAASTALAQQAAKLNIDTTKTLHRVSPMLYGLMTEEINHSYEGGLYAQLLSNHTFRSNWELVRNADENCIFMCAGVGVRLRRAEDLEWTDHRQHVRR